MSEPLSPSLLCVDILRALPESHDWEVTCYGATRRDPEVGEAQVQGFLKQLQGVDGDVITEPWRREIWIPLSHLQLVPMGSLWRRGYRRPDAGRYQRFKIRIGERLAERNVLSDFFAPKVFATRAEGSILSAMLSSHWVSYSIAPSQQVPFTEVVVSCTEIYRRCLAPESSIALAHFDDTFGSDTKLLTRLTPSGAGSATIRMPRYLHDAAARYLAYIISSPRTRELANYVRQMYTVDAIRAIVDNRQGAPMTAYLPIEAGSEIQIAGLVHECIDGHARLFVYRLLQLPQDGTVPRTLKIDRDQPPPTVLFEPGGTAPTPPNGTGPRGNGDPGTQLSSGASDPHPAGVCEIAGEEPLYPGVAAISTEVVYERAKVRASRPRKGQSPDRPPRPYSTGPHGPGATGKGATVAEIRPHSSLVPYHFDYLYKVLDVLKANHATDANFIGLGGFAIAGPRGNLNTFPITVHKRPHPWALLADPKYKVRPRQCAVVHVRHSTNNLYLVEIEKAEDHYKLRGFLTQDFSDMGPYTLGVLLTALMSARGRDLAPGSKESPTYGVLAKILQTGFVHLHPKGDSAYVAVARQIHSCLTTPEEWLMRHQISGVVTETVASSA